ncbi:MAG: dihydroxy-acid dehydratase, partial [Coriobacteriales bacterium]
MNSTTSETILQRLGNISRGRVAAARHRTSLDEIAEQARARDCDTGFPFEKALAADGMSFICECKKASPSKGVISEDYPYLQIARDYEDAGADCISVLTEPTQFQGSDEHLRQIAEAVKQGIWAAGGIPVEFGIPATCGNIPNGVEEMKYEQVMRDIVCMSVEAVSKVHQFDGICMIASCDNIIAG